MRTKPFYLFWCTTSCGSEDWFVVAPTAGAAARFHEDAEGFNRGNAHAERICRVPDDIKVECGWPDDGVIEACGGEFLARVPEPGYFPTPLHELAAVGCRIVRIGDRTFVEGDVVARTIATRRSKG